MDTARKKAALRGGGEWVRQECEHTKDFVFLSFLHVITNAFTVDTMNGMYRPRERSNLTSSTHPPTDLASSLPVFGKNGSARQVFPLLPSPLSRPFALLTRFIASHTRQTRSARPFILSPSSPAMPSAASAECTTACPQSFPR